MEKSAPETPNILTKTYQSALVKFSDHFNVSFVELLVQRGVIDQKQLEELQNEKKEAKGSAQEKNIGQILLEKKWVTEAESIRIINDHYHLNENSLLEDLEKAHVKKFESLLKKLALLRLPIWFQLSLSTTLIIILAISLLSYITLARQKEELYEQTVTIGTVSLNYFANNASIPLIEDNVLRLNTLIKEATSVGGILYAFITDNEQTIKAHTDLNLINENFAGFVDIGEVRQLGDIIYFKRRIQGSGENILNLTKPVIFNEKRLGDVNVGISLDYIDRAINKAKMSIVGMTSLVLIVGIGIAVLLGFRFSRPILKLVMATEAFTKGKYDNKVTLATNDELKDLALAFNHMGRELWLKSVMMQSFGKYVGEDVLNMIVANPQSAWVKGHRSRATTLFTDIRGFTEYSNTHEPEKVVENLNEVFGVITQIIMKHGGYVDKFIGDGVLASFGVPIYHKNHAERAVRAALEMQKTFAQKNTRGDTLLGKVGIGINTGIVIAGNIGSEVKMEYTVIGDSVNVASRLTDIAGAGETVISQEVLAELGDLVEVDALPPKQIKGISEPVEAFKVLGIVPKKT